MAKNVFAKSFYLFYKVNCFFLVIEQSYSLQKIWTLKKRIIITLRKQFFFHIKRQFSPVYFPFPFFVFFFFKENQNNMLVQKNQLTTINSNITTFD